MPNELLALVVPQRVAQKTLQKVHEEGLLDGRRKVVSRGGLVEIPVYESICEAPIKDLSFHEIVHQKRPDFYYRTPKLVTVLGDNITATQRSILPTGWYILGKVIVVKIDPRLDDLKKDIGRALLSVYPRCKCVLRDLGIDGQFRVPRREVIAGNGTETVHRENGVSFKLDAMKIMFSQGNLKERMRMSHLGKNEIVVDMFAGIGYFSLPMAVHSRPSKIYSIELNPTAYGYLMENLRLNHVEDIVSPIFGDCFIKAPENVAHRVIMGYVGNTNQYLSAGIKALRRGGVLHYHQTVPERLYPHALENEVQSVAFLENRGFQVLRCAKVKKYSPGMLHAVLDVKID